MTAYGIAFLRNPQPHHPEVLEYLERIQGTLDPYGGRFLVHGGKLDVVEGTGPGAVVVIEFPGPAEARAWYDSAPYQEILPLRTDNIDGDVLLVEGVEPGHDSAKMAALLRQQAHDHG
jgi:uncharacterized protein (DUF1330 family)